MAHARDNPNTSPCILVVDDTPTNVHLLERVLKKEGFEVRTAAHGEAALHAVGNALPDLILLDINMPGIDGFEVCRRLKEKTETRNIPVILMSAMADTASRLKAFDVGSVDFIANSFSMEEMLLRVKTHLALRRTQIGLEEANRKLEAAHLQLEHLNAELENRVASRTRELEEANQALRESERKFRELAEMLPQTVFEAAPDGKLTFVNHQALKMFGFTMEDYRRGLHALHIIAEEDRPRAKEGVRKVMAGLEATGQEFTAVKKTGERFPVDVFCTPMMRGDSVVGVRGIIIDATERKRTEAVQAARVRLGARALDHSVPALLRALLDEVESITRSRFGFLCMISGGDLFVEKHVWSTRAAEEVSKFRTPGVGYPTECCGVCVKCVKTRAPVILNGEEALGDSMSPPIGEHVVTRVLAIPICREKEVVAVLGVCNRDTDYDQRDVGTVTFLADMAWDIVVRRQAEEEAWESEARFRALVENASDGVAVFQDGVFKFANAAVTALTGFALDELMRMPFIEIVAKKDRETVTSRHNARLAGKAPPHAYEIEILPKNGPPLSVELSAAALRFGGRPATMAIFRDITERRKAEAELRKSQQFLSAIVENEPECVKVVDKEGALLDMNPAGLAMIRAPDKTSVVGRCVYDWIHEDDREAFRQFNLRVCAGAKERLEFTVVDLSGREHRVESTSVPLPYGSDGETVHLGVARDITERRKAEEALRKSEDRLRTVLEASGDYIIMLDMKHEIRFINRTEPGTNRSAIIGKPLFTLVDPSEQERVRSHLDRILAGAERQEYETFYRRPDGSERHFYSVAVPLVSAGEVVGTVVNSRDVTEYRELEQQLRQAQKMEAIGQLAGGVAHDFNNQLTGIMNYADLLREDLSDPTHRLYANMILRAGERAADLTAQLLAFSRKGKFRVVEVDVHKTIAEVVSMLERSIDKRITTSQDLAADSSITMGDPTQLQNALLNLALNARDALPEGGKITMATEVITADQDFIREHPHNVAPGRYLAVKVSDTGIGMSPETQRHIFEPFFTTKDTGAGTGMGLAAVYGTIHNHNGTIEVQSRLGKGTTVTIFLPLVDNTETSTTDPGAETTVDGGAARILLVDDEQSIRHSCSTMLRHIGYHVVTHKDGAAATAYYREAWQQIDLVLLDMVMPEMNGRDAFLAMKKVNPNVKALLLSGFGLDSRIQEVLDKGVLGFLQKPFRMSRLAKAVEEALGVVANTH